MILEYNGLCLDTCAVGMQCMLHKEKHETNFAVYIAAVIISKHHVFLPVHLPFLNAAVVQCGGDVAPMF